MNAIKWDPSAWQVWWHVLYGRYFFCVALEVINRLSESHRLQLEVVFPLILLGFSVHGRIEFMRLRLLGRTCTTHFLLFDVSGHGVAVGSSSVTAALVYLLIWSDLVFPERSRFSDRCWWTFYLFFLICSTGEMLMIECGRTDRNRCLAAWTQGQGLKSKSPRLYLHLSFY